mmetsp:Transcript_16136/g.16267  ORF Transcript_16136/g.16267 Transcript_16136/m.16267 type:complete len:368 (-) Transcript_16136:307-1410(-)|eukprot:CAMPEP_0182416864 /NCGR_PEP_ID=MMETSP1167-20130531/1245_1 /TAXON_ID=2988 /ORGANISM="Mallomonas Sp, Strain CCMP3275" /LENGTH=367 /DNA_ID=CAMNT_0024589993 /DNA_START=71 /DNA_END=1174 /DNA_ORIENTATION=-
MQISGLFLFVIVGFFACGNAYLLARTPRGMSRLASLQAATEDISVAMEQKKIPKEGTMMSSPAFKFFNFFMSIPIIHDIMFGVYRKQIVEKAEKMGLPWTEFMDEMWESLPELEASAAKLTNPEVKIPEYYYAQIHAYNEGNLCWESAMEEDLWSKLMIAPLYNNALDGDVQMRQKWLSITNKVIKPEPKFATDLGCGTGLSMYMLDSKWPSIEAVTGVDLSTYKLAVCEQKKSMMPTSKAEKYTILHGPAEATQVPSNSQDLVSLCLVAHESPKWVSESLFAEAYRILKPGGSFTMLDLDKDNLENLLENPFVSAIYKQTEPYMQEFLKVNPLEDLPKAGFEVTAADNASKSHKVYVGRKPETVEA